MREDSGKDNRDIGRAPSAMVAVSSLDAELASKSALNLLLIVGVKTDDSGRSRDNARGVDDGMDMVGGEDGSERLRALDIDQ